MNLRYASMWDMPLCLLAVTQLTTLSHHFGRRQALALALALVGLCAYELHQYCVFFVDARLYGAGRKASCARSIFSNSRQLHPWLVPHSVQTPHAPARMTLSLPQLEQLTSIYVAQGFLHPLGVRVAGAAVELRFPSEFVLFVTTSMISFSPVRCRSGTGRFTAFFSMSASSFIGSSLWPRFGEVASL